MKYLGIDYGAKRVGIAVSDEEGKVAFARVVLPNDQFLLVEIEKMCKEEKLSAIVMGESNQLSGEPNPIMASIREFSDTLKKNTGLPLFFEPEFFTSAEAERIQGKNEKHDASAAAIILQSYLNKQQHNA